MPERNPAVESAMEGELALLTPKVRRSPERVGALLHPDFHEFGASGRHWSRAAIIASLAATAESGDESVAVSALRGVQLAPDLVHLTYDTEYDGSHAHRSSLWRRTEGRWLLWFHQATPFSAPAT
ncbi:nuclear transport factor 2 family protein [Streptomyces iakyrus]|uniref:nuclear transport factor 2 family protein n=1 Tax=Streptomyces iakyrus TaxID=68219 RepID=UPI0033B17AF9